MTESHGENEVCIAPISYVNMFRDIDGTSNENHVSKKGSTLNLTNELFKTSKV